MSGNGSRWGVLVCVGGGTCVLSRHSIHHFPPLMKRTAQGSAMGVNNKSKRMEKHSDTNAVLHLIYSNIF